MIHKAIDPQVGNDQNACEELTDLDLIRIKIDGNIDKIQSIVFFL